MTREPPKPPAKTFVIKRDAPVCENAFKTLCQDKLKGQVTNSRLTKGKLIGFLAKRYKGNVAKLIAGYFDFAQNYNYEQFLDEIEQLLNFKQD